MQEEIDYVSTWAPQSVDYDGAGEMSDDKNRKYVIYVLIFLVSLLVIVYVAPEVVRWVQTKKSDTESKDNTKTK